MDEKRIGEVETLLGSLRDCAREDSEGILTFKECGLLVDYARYLKSQVSGKPATVEQVSDNVEVCGVYRCRATGVRVIVHLTATCPSLPEQLVVFSTWLSSARIAVQRSLFLVMHEKDCDD